MAGNLLRPSIVQSETTRSRSHLQLDISPLDKKMSLIGSISRLSCRCHTKYQENIKRGSLSHPRSLWRAMMVLNWRIRPSLFDQCPWKRFRVRSNSSLTAEWKMSLLGSNLRLSLTCSIMWSRSFSWTPSQASIEHHAISKDTLKPAWNKMKRLGWLEPLCRELS